MKQFHTKIGEHTFLINSSPGYLVKFLKDNFAEINDAINPKPDMLINIELGYGVPFVNYKVDITEKDQTIYFRRADYLIEVDNQFKIAKVFVHNELALKHALMNLYSSFIVYHNWGLLIHSSCAIENGKAHIFSGQSGAGKSTAAKLSYPRELLSDEASIVKITPKEITVFDSPFRSEQLSDGFTGNCPLASIQLLNQALQIKRDKVRKSDALFALMDKVFYWPHSQVETKRILGLLTNLVQNVPVYQLHFRKDNTFWELIS